MPFAHREEGGKSIDGGRDEMPRVSLSPSHQFRCDLLRLKYPYRPRGLIPPVCRQS